MRTGTRLLDHLDTHTIEELDRRVVRVPCLAAILLVVGTAFLMGLRQHPHLGLWRFSSSEFEAIGTWFSGAAAALTIGTGAYLVLNERRRQEVRERMSNARQVQYVYVENGTSRWVLHNGSSRSIRVTAAGGKKFPSRTVLAGGELLLEPASMFARAGYRGDQPQDTDLIRFSDGEYDWSCEGENLWGTRITSLPGPESERSARTSMIRGSRPRRR